MKLKNYTSEVPAIRSMAMIEQCLIDIGASNVNKKYENKICVGISFLHHDAKLGRTIAYTLKAQVQECFEVMWKERSKQGQLEKFRQGVMD